MNKFRTMMKENIKNSREKIDNKYQSLEEEPGHVGYAIRLHLSALRDQINEIEKKLDRLPELDSSIQVIVQNDIEELWFEIKHQIQLLGTKKL